MIQVLLALETSLVRFRLQIWTYRYTTTFINLYL